MRRAGVDQNCRATVASLFKHSAGIEIDVVIWMHLNDTNRQTLWRKISGDSPAATFQEA